MSGPIERLVRGAGYESRSDLMEAMDRAWRDLGRAGTWYSGADRLRIAAEARRAADCPYCRECKAALSPYGVEGRHQSATELPDAVVDVAHRVVTNPSRLTETWFRRVLDQGVSEGEYAEIVGTVVTLVAVDRFLRALSLPTLDWPAATPGEPVRLEPPLSNKSYAWLRTVSTRDANDQLRRAWFGDRSPGFVPRVRQALSLAPDVLESFIPLSEAMYIPSLELAIPTWSRPGLTRRESELIATRSAAYNDCFY